MCKLKVLNLITLRHSEQNAYQSAVYCISHFVLELELCLTRKKQVELADDKLNVYIHLLIDIFARR